MIQRYVGFGLLGTAAIVAVILPPELAQPATVHATPPPLPNEIVLSGVLRDFTGDHIDFNVLASSGHVAGNVDILLPANNRPTYGAAGYSVAAQWRNAGGQPIAPHLGGFQVLPEINILLVVRNDTTLSYWDDVRKSLMESWGYTVNVIDDEASQAEFDAAFAVNDVAYVSEKACANAVSGKLGAAPIGVVSEDSQLSTTEFGFSSDKSSVSGTNLEVTDNTHYITEGFSGTVAISSSSVSLHRASGFVAPGGQELGELPGNGNPALMVVEAGGSLEGGGTAVARRVRLPWGPVSATAPADDDEDGGAIGCGSVVEDDDEDGTVPPAGFDFGSLNANAHTIMQRSVEWGAGETICRRIADTLGSASLANGGTISTQTTFDQWFRDVPGVNQSWLHSVTLTRAGSLFTFLDTAFYPIDGQLLGNDGDGTHNRFFTYTIDARFDYVQCADQFVSVEGHDDMWLYVDGRLVLDVGGLRPGTEQVIHLDRLGFEDGKSYRLLLFYAQRQGSTSRFMLRTNFVLDTSGAVPPVFAQFD